MKNLKIMKVNSLKNLKDEDFNESKKKTLIVHGEQLKEEGVVDFLNKFNDIYIDCVGEKDFDESVLYDKRFKILKDEKDLDALIENELKKKKRQYVFLTIPFKVQSSMFFLLGLENNMNKNNKEHVYKIVLLVDNLLNLMIAEHNIEVILNMYDGIRSDTPF